ncbi:hypothetical protein FB645_000676 [Coemansia sp. IMI 203386]|nr:hypothetical protein FB645_000676 [Coemansia sp. IMI 203386]
MVVPQQTHSDPPLPLSKLALGCGVFSGAYGAAPDTSVVGSVRRALSSGMNLLDTSPYYNDSEQKLGQALHHLRHEFPRSSYHICTKLGRYGYSKTDFDYSAERVTQSVTESMRRLKTSYLDIVLCHDVEFVSIDQVVDQALPRLFELKAQGLVKKVGLLNTYIPKLRENGVATIVSASPLSMGLLSQNKPPEWHPAKKELREAVALCVEVVEQSGCATGLAEMAEHFAFSCTGADVHLVGAKTEDEVTRALVAYEQALQLQLANGGKYPDPATHAVYEKIQSILKPFDSYTWPSPPADA